MEIHFLTEVFGVKEILSKYYTIGSFIVQPTGDLRFVKQTSTVLSFQVNSLRMHHVSLFGEFVLKLLHINLSNIQLYSVYTS